VWPCLVEVSAVFGENREQVALADDQKMIEALPAHASKKALADGIRPRSSHGRLEHSYAYASRRSVEVRPVLVVAIADDEARADAEGSRVAQPLGDPGRGRLARHGELHEPTGSKLDYEERENRTKPKVVDSEEIARHGLMAVVAQKGRPGLAARKTSSNTCGDEKLMRHDHAALEYRW
jgi:hypothetical protein